MKRNKRRSRKTLEPQPRTKPGRTWKHMQGTTTRGEATSQIQDPTQLWQKNQETKLMRRVIQKRRTEISLQKKKRKTLGRTRMRKCILQMRTPKATTWMIVWMMTQRSWIDQPIKTNKKTKIKLGHLISVENAKTN